MTVMKKTPTKPAAKKTTVTKPAVKKATVKPAAKPVEKTASSNVELSVNGNKKIGTLQKEFTKKFPYLGLIFFDEKTTRSTSYYTNSPIGPDKTLASVRKIKSSGDISINGNKMIDTLEAEFSKIYGLDVWVCWYQKDKGATHAYDVGNWTLSKLNKDCMEDTTGKSQPFKY